MQFKLEICCYNLHSAIIAQEFGAHRVELCADPAGGGTTPGPGVILAAREQLRIAVYPIIRPRGGDFIFSDEEFGTMQKDVAFCKSAGCDGVVIGLLHADGTVDKKRTAKLAQLAYPMGVTFHRAFDRAINPFEALEDIIETGCERILSSGQQPTALEGAGLLNELVRQADDRIIIMPGSGVRSHNILELADKTDASEYHTSAGIKSLSKMTHINPGMQEDLSIIMADGEEIKAIMERLAGRKAP